MKNRNNETQLNFWDEGKKRICERKPFTMDNAEQHVEFYVEMTGEIISELKEASNPCAVLCKMQKDTETTHVRFEYAPSYLETFNEWKFEICEGVLCCTVYGLLEDWGSYFKEKRIKWIEEMERIVRSYASEAGYEQFQLHWSMENKLIFNQEDLEYDVVIWNDRYSTDGFWKDYARTEERLEVQCSRAGYGYWTTIL